MSIGKIKKTFRNVLTQTVINTSFLENELGIRKGVKKTVLWTVFSPWDSAKINLTNKPYQAGLYKNILSYYPNSLG